MYANSESVGQGWKRSGLKREDIILTTKRESVVSGDVFFRHGRVRRGGASTPEGYRAGLLGGRSGSSSSDCLLTRIGIGFIDVYLLSVLCTY